jgi:O-antigen ligase
MMPPRRRLWSWRAASLVPAFAIAVFLSDPSAPQALRLEALAVLLVTLSRPALGLMLVVLVAPLGDAIVPFVGGPPARHAETVVVAFLAGWLSARGSEDQPSHPLLTNLVTAMWVLGGVLVASVASTAWQLGRESPVALQNTLAALTHSYLLTDDVIGAHTAAQLLEGLGLLGAAAVTARRPRDRARLRLAIVASGLVASIASGLLGLHLAPLRTLSRYAFIGKRRFSAITGDVNAAGSSYLLYLGVTAGITVMAWPNRRRVWLTATGLILFGLVITGSAAAMVAAAIVLGVGTIRWIGSISSRRRQMVGALALAAIIIGAIVFARSDRSTRSLGMRGGFTQASLRFIEARPIFGIGAGRYYPLSLLVLPTDLSWVYGRENAHDYYLQIFAELGLVGLAGFGWVLAAALGAAVKRVWQRRADPLTVGCVAGALAYLVTALAGHPFLVPETMIPFWIVVGLLAGEQPQAPAVRPAWRRSVAIGFAGVLLLTAPLRPGVPAVRVPPADEGFGAWQLDPTSGRSFREAGLRASLFLGPAIKAVEIPMRMAGSRGGSIVITVDVAGSSRSELSVGHDWGTILVPLPGTEPMMPRQRINLAVTAVSGPAAGHDLRMDIGQIRIVTAQ